MRRGGRAVRTWSSLDWKGMLTSGEESVLRPHEYGLVGHLELGPTAGPPRHAVLVDLLRRAVDQRDLGSLVRVPVHPAHALVVPDQAGVGAVSVLDAGSLGRRADHRAPHPA